MSSPFPFLSSRRRTMTGSPRDGQRTDYLHYAFALVVDGQQETSLWWMKTHMNQFNDYSGYTSLVTMLTILGHTDIHKLSWSQGSPHRVITSGRYGTKEALSRLAFAAITHEYSIPVQLSCYFARILKPVRFCRVQKDSIIFWRRTSHSFPASPCHYLILLDVPRLIPNVLNVRYP